MRGSKASRTGLLAVVGFCCLAAGSPYAMAQSSEDPTARLRAALRQATMRVRELEDQNATLQAKQAEFDRDRLALTQKAAASEKSLQVLHSQNRSSQAALQQNAEEQRVRLAKWEAAYKEAADTARARDGDAKRFEAALTALREQNRIAEQKNAELYRLGQELLSLYENKHILDVLGAGEPVTKLKRVEYENVIQDYQDKLRANRVVRPPAQ